MTFKNPELIVVIAFLPLIFLFTRSFCQKRKTHLLFPNFGKLRPSAPSFFVKTPLILDLVATLLLVLAFMRPVSLDRVVTPPVEGRDIMVVLDVSGSMKAVDFKPRNRLEAAKTVIRKFVRERRSDRIGLVFFAADSFLQVPLTTDYSIFVNLMERLDTDAIEDGTAIGNGLALALSRLTDSKTKSRTILLLTDGDNNRGNVNPVDAAELAAEHGVKVYSILIGTDKPVPFPVGKDVFGREQHRNVTMKTDPELLKRISKRTGGKFYQSITTEELKKAFSDIDALEKSPVPAKQYKLFNEFAPWFIIFGILLIVLARITALFIPVYPEVER